MHNSELFRLKAELCKTFADATRLAIINELRSGERLVGELAQTLNIPQAVTSRHLALLRNRGVVRPRREGTNVYYSLSDQRLIQAVDLLREVLEAQMAADADIAKALASAGP